VTILVTNQTIFTRTEPHNPEHMSARHTLKRHHATLTGRTSVD
jgi:hypothetical protein